MPNIGPRPTSDYRLSSIGRTACAEFLTRWVERGCDSHVRSVAGLPGDRDDGQPEDSLPSHVESAESARLREELATAKTA